MTKLIVKLLIGALAVYFSSEWIDGVSVDDFTTALLTGLIISVLNAVVRPILVVLTIPITILTLGLSLLVLNTILILAADSIVDGFTVWGFVPAFYFSITNWFIQLVLNMFNPFKNSDD